jgi:hypothetical protein
MTTIKCTCGNKGCSTVIFIAEGTGYINLVSEYKDGEKEISHETALDPNAIVQLIKELKQALQDIAA